MGLGTVVGTRTWGGLLTVAESAVLIDGSEISMPSENVIMYHKSASDSGGGRGGGNPIENSGVVPDIEVGSVG